MHIKEKDPQAEAGACPHLRAGGTVKRQDPKALLAPGGVRVVAAKMTNCPFSGHTGDTRHEAFSAEGREWGLVECAVSGSPM